MVLPTSERSKNCWASLTPTEHPAPRRHPTRGEASQRKDYSSGSLRAAPAPALRQPEVDCANSYGGPPGPSPAFRQPQRACAGSPGSSRRLRAPASPLVPALRLDVPGVLLQQPARLPVTASARASPIGTVPNVGTPSTSCCERPHQQRRRPSVDNQGL